VTRSAAARILSRRCIAGDVTRGPSVPAAAGTRHIHGLLTTIVSLEAIFLSTSRTEPTQGVKRRPICKWQNREREDKHNQQLRELSGQILDLTKAIHSLTVERSRGA
jgi:hypothetical protein